MIQNPYFGIGPFSSNTGAGFHVEQPKHEHEPIKQATIDLLGYWVKCAECGARGFRYEATETSKATIVWEAERPGGNGDSK